jgi:hypothetical protein
MPTDRSAATLPFVASETRLQHLVRTGRVAPRFLQGVFPFVGRGLFDRGKFFARDRLLDLVWGLDFDGGERTLDIHVTRLRAKLPPDAAAFLDTRRGVGYGFRVPHP